MKIKSLLLIAVGFVCLLFAVVGLVLPVWPTTPFVLCSAGCFAGSPRLRAGLMRVEFFREYIDSYQNKKGLSRRTVARSMVFLWGMLLLSCLLASRWWITLLLLVIGTAVTAHILYIARERQP